MDSLALRDHAVQILEAIAHDLETFQSRAAQTEKSLGRKPIAFGAPETAAQTHAILRARSGFDINQLVAEYRALCLWTDAYAPSDGTQFEQVIRSMKPSTKRSRNRLAISTRRLSNLATCC